MDNSGSSHSLKTLSEALLPSLGPELVRTIVASALHLPKLDRLYSEARQAHSDLDLAASVLEALEIRVSLDAADLGRIPREGPAIIVANHPFGLLDGLILENILSKVRSDAKILTNRVLTCFTELQSKCIPVEVFNSRSAVHTNALALRSALDWLEKGGAVALFPAGEVAHWSPRRGKVTDPPWQRAVARLASRSGAPVVPVHFSGANSLAFHLSGLIHPILRTARIPQELLNKRGQTFEVRIGGAIPAAQLAALESDHARVEYLRSRTYLLARRSTPREHEPAANSTAPCLDQESSASANAAIREIESLPASALLVENTCYAVYLERGQRIPAILEEVGRLRELTFRTVGEGTGETVDLDRFDREYFHLILWHKPAREIAGAYRLAWSTDVLPRFGAEGLYTSTLFRYDPFFFERLGNAVELGRSFIQPKYQKEFATLLLLWQAIGRAVHRRPEAPVLFGAVSISREYSDASREMLVECLRHPRFRHPLSQMVRPRCPVRTPLLPDPELRSLARSCTAIDDLSAPMRDLNDPAGVPVLLRQYMRLGARIAGFNLDRNFSNVVDGLVIVDLRRTEQRLLEKYMGRAEAREFLSRQGAGVLSA